MIRLAVNRPSQGEGSRIDLFEVVRPEGVGRTTYAFLCDFGPRAESFRFEHDKEKRVFRLTDAEGKTECIRDKPARYLVVEPDRETGRPDQAQSVSVVSCQWSVVKCA
jgi:hypothetical protein